MTPENIEFVRNVNKDAHSILWHGPQHDTPLAQALIDLAKQEANIKLRLLTLLVEAEAMREKAEFEAEHYWDNSGVTDQCFGCGEEMCIDKRRKWTDSDWQRSVRERWNIE